MSIIEEFQHWSQYKLANVTFTILITLVVCNIIIKIIHKILDNLNIDLTILRFVKQVIKVITYFVGALIISGSFGVNTSSLVALFSIFTAAFALAAQSSLSNIFGGLLLLLTKPFSVKDYVNVGGTEGSVVEIQMLNTILKTADNKRVTIPNGTVSSSTIINYSYEGQRRMDITIDASYEDSLDNVKQALNEAVEMTNNISIYPKPMVRLSGYGDSNIHYLVRVWVSNQYYWDVHFDLLENVKRSFEKHNITISYPRVVVGKEEAGK
mgnify:FL=1